MLNKFMCKIIGHVISIPYGYTKCSRCGKWLNLN